MQTPTDQNEHRGPNRDTSAAVAVKRAQATANRQRIADAIVNLQRRGAQVTVAAVARESGVSQDTIRRNPDLHKEVAHLRGQGWQRKSDVRPGTTDRATYDAMKGRWLAAQAEVSRLRKALTEARRATHQALGTQGQKISPDALSDLKSENANLHVRLMEMMQEIESLKDERVSLTGELTAAHEVNREYVRQLTQARDRLVQAERELGALRMAQRR
jgi:chromosome segregation ATPase